MGTEYVDVLLLTIQRKVGQSQEFTDVVSFQITTTQEKKPVYTMRRQRTAKGFRKGARTIQGEMEIGLPVGGLPIDFESMINGEEFNILVTRGDGGTRKTVVGAQVSEVQESSNGEGEHTLRVSFVATDYRPDAPTVAA